MSLLLSSLAGGGVLPGALAAEGSSASPGAWASLSDQEKYSSYGFFVWKSENTNLWSAEREDAEVAAELLKERTNRYYPSVKANRIGAVGDATHLDNFEAALYESQAINAYLVKQLGLKPKLASDYEFAAEQSWANDLRWLSYDCEDEDIKNGNSCQLNLVDATFFFTAEVGITSWRDNGDSSIAKYWLNNGSEEQKRLISSNDDFPLATTAIAGDVVGYPNSLPAGKSAVITHSRGTHLGFYPSALKPIDVYLELLAEYKRVLAGECEAIVSPAEQTINAGEYPSFPATVSARYTNGTTKEVHVSWDTAEPAGFTSYKGGTFTFTGTTQEAGACASVTLKVIVQPATVSSVAHPESVTVSQGGTLRLPESLEVTWSNGEKSNEPVTWDASRVNVDVLGTYSVTGSVAGASLALKVNVVEAYAQAAVSPDPLAVENSVAEGALDLPTHVNVKWSNGTTSQEPVVWDPLTQEQKNILTSISGGSFDLHGTVTVSKQQKKAQPRRLFARFFAVSSVMPAGAPVATETKLDVTVRVNVKPATVKEVASLAQVRTDAGVAPQLPQTAKVTWSNGQSSDEPITWEQIDSSKYMKIEGGSFEVSGTVASTTVTVTVKVAHADFISVDLETDTVETVVGQAPVLPDAIAHWSNNLTEKTGIVWDEVSEESYAQPGEFTVQGWIIYRAEKIRQESVKVIVKAKADENPAAESSKKTSQAGADKTAGKDSLAVTGMNGLAMGAVALVLVGAGAVGVASRRRAR